MAEALVSSEVLRWARERAGLPPEVLAKKIGSATDKIVEWESGISLPTFRQAEKLAHATYIPFGYLFLSEPPEEEMLIPDLRTTAGAHLPHLDADFKDALRDVQFKLDWYRDYRIDQGYSPLTFVGRFAVTARAVDVAEDIRETLGVDGDQRDGTRGWEEYFRLLVEKAEAVGIWVLRNGVVGNNSHRPLSVEVFRGFAISDEVVPTIFVNGRDAKAAQIFTLAHELAHIWLGVSGVSDPLRAGTGRHHNNTEELCNSIAAEFLLPRVEFKTAWNKNVTLEVNAQSLSVRFRVSPIVVAIRAREMALINQAAFDAFFGAEKVKWGRARTDSSGGGDYYRTAKTRNGELFLRAVLASAMSGRLLLRQASALLNMAPKVLYETHRRLEAGRI